MNPPWTAWLKIAHAALVVVLACYLVMVAVNSFLFGYNYWDDPPPSDTAELFAVVSLGVLFVVTSSVGAVTYSWMCGFALDPAAGVRAPLRRAGGVALARWWIAVPGFALTLLGCVFFLPGIVPVALLGPLPLRHWERRGGEQPAPRYGAFESSLGTGAVVAFVVASTVWAAVLVGGDLVSRFDGPVEAVAALLAYLAYICSALAAGWASWAFASPQRRTGRVDVDDR